MNEEWNDFDQAEIQAQQRAMEEEQAGELAAEEKALEIVHVPAQGRGQGFNWISECGRLMKTRTGDVAPMQREARAIAAGLKKEDTTYGRYCSACLKRLRQVV